MDVVGCKNERLGHNPPLYGMEPPVHDGPSVAEADGSSPYGAANVASSSSCDFDLGPEQLALLVGANGSGKTTLLRILAGLGSSDGGQRHLEWTSPSATSRASSVPRLLIVVTWKP